MTMFHPATIPRGTPARAVEEDERRRHELRVLAEPRDARELLEQRAAPEALRVRPEAVEARADLYQA